MITADLFSRLLHQPELLSEVSTEELEQLGNKYPWFGTAHLLLAAKMKQTGNVSAHQQEQKAALFFNRSLLFSNELKTYSNALKEKASAVSPATVLTEDDRLTDETDAALDAEVVIETEDLTEKELAPISDTVLDAEVLLEAETLKEEMNAPVNDSVLDAETLLEAELIKEELYAPVTDAVLDAEVLVNVENEKEVRLQQEVQETTANAEAIIESADAKETLNVVPAISKPEPLLVFEPYHTVDYFASQGIRLQEDKLGNDRLGQQVKSFTQWLKSMKKIYVEEQQELNAKEEKAVVTKASESNQREEVITEAMADVLVKQGKLPQAIELYNKLSLLHPEKSAYFATLIKELKS